MEPEAKRRKVDGSGRDWRGGRGRGGRGRAGGRGGGRGRGERGGGRDKWEPNDTAKNPQTPSTMKSVSRMPVIRATVPLPNDILPTEEEMGIIEYLDKTGRTPFRVCFKQRYASWVHFLSHTTGTLISWSEKSPMTARSSGSLTAPTCLSMT